MPARLALPFAFFLALAACGADGLPAYEPTGEPGVELSGEARVGVVVPDPSI